MIYIPSFICTYRVYVFYVICHISYTIWHISCVFEYLNIFTSFSCIKIRSLPIKEQTYKVFIIQVKSGNKSELV